MFADVVRWVFAYGGLIFTAAVLAAGAISSWRLKRLPTWFVFGIAVTTMFWAETYGDWGSYVLYDPTLPQMPWGEASFTAPSKPWGILGGYCWFYLLWALSTRPLLRMATRKLPNWHTYGLALVIAVPLWFIWDVAIEFSMVHGGVWSYIEPYWPVLHSERGTFPLLWPLVAQIPFMAFATWIFASQDDAGLTPLDRFVIVGPPRPVSARVTRTAQSRGAADHGTDRGSETLTVDTRPHRAESPHWHIRYELTRLVTWCVAFNLLFLGTIIIPLVVVRLLFGEPNVLIP